MIELRARAANSASQEVGTKISGLTLAEPNDRDIEKLKTALRNEHLAIFPDQALDKDQLVALGQKLGAVETFPVVGAIEPSRPSLYPVSNDPAKGFVDIGQYWHSDGSFRPKSTRYSLFYMVTPALSGGQTGFADLAAAFDALDPGDQELAQSLHTIHGNGTRHPLVTVDETTGQRRLYINFGMTTGLYRPNAAVVGIWPHEADALWSRLKAIFDEPTASYTHEWQKGDLVIADNLAIAHRAYPVTDHSVRLLWRVTTN